MECWQIHGIFIHQTILDQTLADETATLRSSGHAATRPLTADFTEVLETLHERAGRCWYTTLHWMGQGAWPNSPFAGASHPAYYSNQRSATCGGGAGGANGSSGAHVGGATVGMGIVG